MTFTLPSFLQQQQRPDLARLMQMQAQAQAGAAGLPGGLPAGLPAGLFGGATPGQPSPAGAGGAPGLPTTLSLLAGIPTSLASSLAGGPGGLSHNAFVNLLAQQKPGGNGPPTPLTPPSKGDELLKRGLEMNGGKPITDVWALRSTVWPFDLLGPKPVNNVDVGERGRMSSPWQPVERLRRK